MLQIKDIRKQYVTGELVQTALDGVSLNLRDNEFVAILGPSGSGKTTLLNVIGGLDRYDSGDLIINGISTKKYSDRDWDSYRNHTIGFVFQSYNLIPHQSVLANVELALTISGISRSERRKRAAKALESVGLGNQLHKRPNQMSGGQMQRVAIARALVNDPDILLADEPTGALDSETSVQVMDLLKEVSKDRLVVMVTHNPELAEEYANRIVRVKDGRIIGDTNPFQVDDKTLAAPRHKNMGKSSMSFFTALSLSFNNLRTKLARTFLTAFAGSIGIIGIALIMSLSTGFQKYIDKIQEDTLSNYPLALQSETANMGAAVAAFGASMVENASLPEGVVGEQPMITTMFSQIGKNDLGSFKAYLEENFDTIRHTVNTVKYSYGITPRIYSPNTEDILQVNPSTLFGKVTGNASMSAYMDSNVFYEMIDNYEMLESQYDVVLGRWPESYNEMVFVLTNPSSIADYMAYALGMKPAHELEGMISQVMQGEEAVLETEARQWTYEELMSLTFKLVDASSLYSYNEEYQVWEDMSGSNAYMKEVIEGGEELRIVGIVCPQEGANATALSSGIAYTHALTEYVIDRANKSPIVKEQLLDKKIDVFTGKEFGAKDEQSQLNFEDMITIDGDAISSSFGMNISTDSILKMLRNYMNDVVQSMQVDTSPAQEAFTDTFYALATDMLKQYVSGHADESGSAKLYLVDAEAVVDSYLASNSAVKKIKKLNKEYDLGVDTYTQVYRALLIGMVTSSVAERIEVSSASAIATDPRETDTKETEPKETEPKETEPKETEPKETEPKETQSKETQPKETEPKETEPKETEPKETEPKETEPKETEPKETEPKETEPKETEPKETEPKETEPKETEPKETEPKETEPKETDPKETEPKETEPKETEPKETEPKETEPKETEPKETEPKETEPKETEPKETEPKETEPDLDIPPVDIPDVEVESDRFYAKFTAGQVDGIVSNFLSNPVVTGAAGAMASRMSQPEIMAILQRKLSEFGGVLGSYIGNSFYVNEEKLASAFQFNMDEEELRRLMEAMSTQNQEASADANLKNLGYADLDSPTGISIYMGDFAKKEEFIAFLDAYNDKMEAEGKEDQVIRYTDVTGIMMSSVRTIIDSVSYALIAFVAVSLVVSSIMIGIITYISVMERTKEIGVLRAIGASKRNISQVFNAETFIIGLCSGLIGIGTSLLLLIPGNMLIQHLTNNPDIVAQLPVSNAVALILLSMILTLIGGFIPARQAAKKDPVIALRSE